MRIIIIMSLLLSCAGNKQLIKKIDEQEKRIEQLESKIKSIEKDFNKFKEWWE